ncbi:hypothetical protein PALB_13420 [Pseudoalteromonas luteoviolacea B = ATCC 29581]|nr:hypothetical protein PALB_13420 [Pseudoalteromonas luteoviolacea B = ATCC 29581]
MESIDPLLMAYLPKDVRAMLFPYASVQLGALFLNLLIGFGMASLIGFHFRKYASSFCNRQDFSRLFPLLMLTVILIITVVKASLALALGLVGALSIVRFRTPIKEPEELVYLFLNIGVAVALGAGQTLAAVLACFITLALVTLAKKHMSKAAVENGLFISLNNRFANGDNPNVSVEELKSIFSQHISRLELRRFDVNTGGFDATFFVSVTDATQVDAIIGALKNRYPSINISLLEQHNIAGV